MSVTYVDQCRLPGPPPMPLLGARGNLIPFMRNPARYMDYLYNNYGEVVSLARGSSEFVFVFSPEYNQQVLGDPALFFNLDSNSSPLRIPEGSSLARLFAGLTQMNGARHHLQRQLMTPALHKRRIEDYYSDVVAVVEQKLSGWRVGQRLDLYKEMRELTLAVAVKTLLGLDPSSGGDEVCQLLDRWLDSVFSLSSMLLPIDLPGFRYHRLIALSEKLEEIIRAMIERKRSDSGGQRDILSMLVHAHNEGGRQMTDDELVGQTNFLFMAGHATTASALTWALFLLDQHPLLLMNVMDECESKLRGHAPCMKQLDQLVLTEDVIKETMRLLPPVLWWSRISTSAFRLGPYDLPCGTRVIHSAFVTHRIPALYPQPNRFLPGRWRASSPGPYEYLPFSAGPRMCLGSTFAMTEMKLVLATILQRCRLALPAGTRVDFGGRMLSAPLGGMPVLIEGLGRRISRNEVGGNIRRIVNLN